VATSSPPLEPTANRPDDTLKAFPSKLGL